MPPRSKGRTGRPWRLLAARVRAEEPSCRYCGKELLYDVPIGHPDRGTVDHIIPLDERPDLALDRDNVCGACHACNSAKGNRTPEQWRAAQQGTTAVSGMYVSELRIRRAPDDLAVVPAAPADPDGEPAPLWW
jgi:hypothetical protein